MCLLGVQGKGRIGAVTLKCRGGDWCSHSIYGKGTSAVILICKGRWEGRGLVKSYWCGGEGEDWCSHLHLLLNRARN